PEFGDICLAENDKTCGFVARGQKRIVRRRDRRQEPRSLPRRQAFSQTENVLEKEGHACDGALRQLGARRPPCPVIVSGEEEIECRMELFRPPDRFFDELDRFDVSVLDQLGESQPVQVRVFCNRHSTAPVILRRSQYERSLIIVYSHFNGRHMSPRLRTNLRKSASQPRSRATVDALLEAAAPILIKPSYDRASTNRIAHVAGVSIGSLYQYFPSKEALVAALIDRHKQQMMQLLRDALIKVAMLPVEAAARELVKVMMDAHQVDPKLHRVL